MFFFTSRRRHTSYWRDWSSDVCFFVSSRRRHTRYWRDWSSDVCSSDLGDAGTRGFWERILCSPENKKVKRIIVTHYHPDHAGNAAWLCERFGVELWMTQEIGRASCRERV